MLLPDGKPKEALIAYEAVLQKHPNRFDSVSGAANAAFESGDRETAARYDRQLLTFAHGEERPELATARKRTTEQEAAAQ